MGISISPSGFLKLFIDKKYRTNDKVADYLDSIAAEARSLAEVWESLVDDLAKDSGPVAVEADERISKILREYKEPNAPPYWRLRAFYEEVAEVTEGKLTSGYRDNVVRRLGMLLYDRQITLASYRDALRELKDGVFVDDNNSDEAFQDLANLCNSLHREAAAIEVLAKAVRVETA